MVLADNLGDHAAAAALNLQGDRNFLEQSVFVDSITAGSAQRLHKEAVKAWKQAMRSVLAQARLVSTMTLHTPSPNSAGTRTLQRLVFSDKDEAAS